MSLSELPLKGLNVTPLDEPGSDCHDEHVFWGRHFFASYNGCNPERLQNRDLVEAMKEAIQASGANLISEESHFFSNGGMTAVFLLQESHASVHTYPEHRACFVDLFTCGEKTKTEDFDAVMRKYLEPESVDARIFLRHEQNQDSYAAVCVENDGGLSAVLHAGKTDYQSVLIADSPKYGRILVLDGDLQSAEADEHLYHELLVQPPMVLHPNPRRVLIIGGGEGASLREVLKHKTVESVTVLDLDEKIIELSKQHLFSWHKGSFNDPRVNLVISDGRSFLEMNAGKYDVVIIDVLDSQIEGPAKRLYTRQFYQLLKTRLAPGAVLSIQAMKVTELEHAVHASIKRTVQSVFSEVHSYHASIPSFFSDWTFLLVSDWCNPVKLSSKAFDDSLNARVGAHAVKHIDGEFFLSCFHFTRSLRHKLNEPGLLIED